VSFTFVVSLSDSAFALSSAKDIGAAEGAASTGFDDEKNPIIYIF
jgi:hypothetical protein